MALVLLPEPQFRDSSGEDVSITCCSETNYLKQFYNQHPEAASGLVSAGCLSALFDLNWGCSQLKAQ